MTKIFAKVSRTSEFEKDLKKLLKRYRSLEEDLDVFITAQLNLFHKQHIDNHGIFRMNNLDIAHPKIFKAKKFACKALRGLGAASGIRVIYAYYEEQDHIELVQIYFKADDENEDRARIKALYGK
jgi:mRNA-degrading endonuclease RelE of RelBE toxin-antitoxin system